MTSKIRKKYVMTFDLFPEYFLTTIDPQLTKCDIDLCGHTYTHKHIHRQTHKHQLFNSIACEIKDRHTHKRQHYNNLALLMDIEFSIDKLMYKWRDMERKWKENLLFEIMFSSYCIVFRYCTQYKSRSILLKPWFV